MILTVNRAPRINPNKKSPIQRTGDFSLNQSEKSGQTGFLLQEYIASGRKTLRVVIIGQQAISYWRIQENTAGFYSNLSKGAVIDAEAEPAQQHKAVALVKHLCKRTGINLAGFDVIFSPERENAEPMLLEINYFFGRKGLGGSEAYYRILQNEIQAWLNSLDCNF